MPEIEEYKFSFLDLLSPIQAANQRWIELMEVIDQLYEEFVYPELERTKNLRSIYTADEQDLDGINIDKYYYLFESIQKTAKTKRIALWIQQEIIQAKNDYDSIYLAVASLAFPRSAITILPLYHPVDKTYLAINLVNEEAFEDNQTYFLSSKTSISLDRDLVFSTGVYPVEATDSIKAVLKENVIPEHIEIILATHATPLGISKSVVSMGREIKIIIENVT